MATLIFRKSAAATRSEQPTCKFIPPPKCAPDGTTPLTRELYTEGLVSHTLCPPILINARYLSATPKALPGSDMNRGPRYPYKMGVFLVMAFEEKLTNEEGNQVRILNTLDDINNLQSKNIKTHPS